MPIAVTKASTNINKLFNKTDVLTKTVFKDKFVSKVKKSTACKHSPQADKTGINNKTHIPIEINLYNKSFQKTEKFATNNFNEFYEIYIGGGNNLKN